MISYLDKTGLDYLWGKIKAAFVTKDGSKVLSDNNFSTEEKTKLSGIEAGANAYALPTASASVKGGVKVGANLNISADGVLSATTSAIGRYIIEVSYEYGGAETPFTNPTAALSDIAAIASHLAAGEDIILKLTAQGVTDVYYARLFGQSGNAYYNFQLWDGGYLYDVTVWTGSGSIMIQRKL